MDSVNFLNLEYIFLRVADFFKDFDLVAILNNLIYILKFFIPFTTVIAVVALSVILFTAIRLRRITREVLDRLYAKAPESMAPIATDDTFATKWKGVTDLASSANPSDWRLAILEADIMLGDVLEEMGVQGDSIGDKLKSMDKSDLPNIQFAWDAHLVRNQIAHEGSDFQIPEREVKRVIGLYQSIFSSLHKI